LERKRTEKFEGENLETAAGAGDAAVVNNATLNEEHRDYLSLETNLVRKIEKLFVIVKLQVTCR
jgi:hypothetical protein